MSEAIDSSRLGLRLVLAVSFLSALVLGLAVGVAAPRAVGRSSPTPGTIAYAYDGALNNAPAHSMAESARAPAARKSADRAQASHGLGPAQPASGVAAEGATELPAFSQSTIEGGVESAAEPYNKYISEGGRALSKRLGAGSAPFEGIEATTENAQALVQDILEHPTRTVFGARTYDVYNALGQGARLDVGTNRFITFLDETIASR